MILARSLHGSPLFPHTVSLSMRLLALAAVVLAVPAVAQSDVAPAPPTEPVASPVLDVAVTSEVDAALVGAWTLEEVAEVGRLGDLGVEVEDMTCAFSAEGTATVEMEMVQDLDPLTRERTFEYDTEGGLIVVEGDDPVQYQILEDGRLQMTTTDGLVVRMVRKRS